jgi:hypothetical protein
VQNVLQDMAVWIWRKQVYFNNMRQKMKFIDKVTEINKEVINKKWI